MVPLELELDLYRICIPVYLSAFCEYFFFSSEHAQLFFIIIVLIHPEHKKFPLFHFLWSQKYNALCNRYLLFNYTTSPIWLQDAFFFCFIRTLFWPSSIALAQSLILGHFPLYWDALSLVPLPPSSMHESHLCNYKIGEKSVCLWGSETRHFLTMQITYGCICTPSTSQWCYDSNGFDGMENTVWRHGALKFNYHGLGLDFSSKPQFCRPWDGCHRCWPSPSLFLSWSSSFRISATLSIPMKSIEGYGWFLG